MNKVQMIESLISIASELDSNQFHAEAQAVDSIISKLAESNIVMDPVEIKVQRPAVETVNMPEETFVSRPADTLKLKTKEAQEKLNAILEYEGKKKLPEDGVATKEQMALFKAYAGEYKTWGQLFNGLAKKLSELSLKAAGDVLNPQKADKKGPPVMPVNRMPGSPALPPETLEKQRERVDQSAKQKLK